MGADGRHVNLCLLENYDADRATAEEMRQQKTADRTRVRPAAEFGLEPQV